METAETVPPQDAPALETQVAASASEVLLKLRVEAPEGARLRVEVETFTPEGQPLERRSIVLGGAAGTSFPQAARRWWDGEGVSRMRTRLAAVPLVTWLMAAALAIYALTRFYALPDFPIYFFTDEAVQTVSAADLVRDHFVVKKDGLNEFLPTYFENGSQFNLSASVYLQVIPYILLGKSVWVTRGAATLMTLIAAWSVGMILKRAFHSSFPWMAVLFLSATPVWFLHSRTAFETSLAASFYAAFLYFYLRYRLDDPRYLYPSVLAGALTFYAYAPMRVVIGVTALLLLAADAPYHWRNRRDINRGLALALLLALPFVRFLANHPTESEWQMRLLGSYWLKDITLLEKLRLYGMEYLRGLDPVYWYLPHKHDLARHVMLGYGHLLRQTLPLGLLGVGLALFHIRKPAYRTMLAAVLAVPSGAALVHIGATRLLAMVIPMAVLTAVALEAVIGWIHRRWKIPLAGMGAAAFAILALLNGYMLRDALVNGPLWHNDYGLGGMQYGARQLFGALAQELRERPGEHVIVSPSWANGTDVLARFFFPEPLPLQLGAAKGFYNEGLPIAPHMLFVMIPEEFEVLPRERFAEVQVEKTLPYPDGRPGFYFVRLKYVDNIREVVAAEQEARRRLAYQDALVAGESVSLGITALDMGDPKNIFDGDFNTLIRSYAVNPLELDLQFPSAREVSRLTLKVGGTPTTVTAQVWPEGQVEPFSFTQSYPESPYPRQVSLRFDSPYNTRRVKIAVANTNDPPEGNVHLWEVIFE